MRSPLAAFALFAIAFAIPGGASAECSCACNMGQAVGVCSQSYETPPICQHLCPQVLNQQLSTGSLSVTLSPGSIYGGGGSGAAPNSIDAVGAAAAGSVGRGAPGAGSIGAGSMGLGGAAGASPADAAAAAGLN